MKDKKKEEDEEEEETGYVHCVYMIMDTSCDFSRIRYTQNVSHNVRKMSRSSHFPDRPKYHIVVYHCSILLDVCI